MNRHLVTSPALGPFVFSLASLAAPGLPRAQDMTTLSPVEIVAPQPRTDRPTSAGSRLDLSSKQTAASIDLIDRTQLEERGDSSLVNAITRATGITSMAHPGNSGSSLSARGFTDTTSVMRLYDGTRQYGGVGLSFPFDTWSVERIEVLRGPASVVHGDGAIGAVVNVVPKKPTRGPIQNEVQAHVGTDGHRGLAVGSGGALDERWSYRVDLSGARADGWVDRGDNRQLAVNGALQLEVSPELKVKLSHARGDQKPMRYFGTPLINGAPEPALKEKNYNVADSMIRFRDRWTELSAQWTPDRDVTVRSKLYHIVSDRYWRNAEGYRYNTATNQIDRSDNTEIAHDQSQIGNTTDATFIGSLAGRRNQVSIGFDVNRARFQHTNNTYTGSSGPVDLFHPDPGSFVSAAPFIPRYRNSAQQYALFLEDRLEITGRWSVIGGLRHDRADVTRQNLVTATEDFDRRYSNTGWRLGTVYQWSADTAVYAQYAKAADPVSGLLMLSTANSMFSPSSGRQVEVGVKQSFWEGRGDWTFAAYTITKKNLLTRDTANPSQRVQVGQRSSKGVEGTVSVALARAWRLDANVALLEAKYDDFTESVGGVAVSRNGKVPTDVPEQTANLWLGWTFSPNWTASGGLRHVGKRYADNANTNVLPSYTTADLALQWHATPDTTLSLRGFNVFDKYYFTTTYYTATQLFVGEGRRVELSLNHRF